MVLLPLRNEGLCVKNNAKMKKNNNKRNKTKRDNPPKKKTKKRKIRKKAKENTLNQKYKQNKKVKNPPFDCMFLNTANVEGVNILCGTSRPMVIL